MLREIAILPNQAVFSSNLVKSKLIEHDFRPDVVHLLPDYLTKWLRENIF